MTLVLGAFGVRLLAYSLLSSPWLSLPIGTTTAILCSSIADPDYLEQEMTVC
jgi:hypothetical protein